MKITDLADHIFRNLGEPDDVSIPNISFWLEGRIGELNNLINSTIVYNPDTQDFDPELTDEQAVIFGLMYSISYFTRFVRSSLGAAAYDWSEVSEGDTTVRRVSRNEIAKTYQQLRNQLQTELNDLVFFYKQNRSTPYSLSAVHNLLRFYRVEQVK